MFTRGYEPPHDYEQIDKWLESYFLDPLTSYYDQTQFQIDLYETEKEWIVEALLSDYLSPVITVLAQGSKCIITAKEIGISNVDQQWRRRIIQFPFLIINQKIYATFENGILEIHISKEKNED